MQTLLLCLGSTIFYFSVLGQDFPAEVYPSSLDNGTVQIWANNEAYHPISVEVSANLTNMECDYDLPALLVVPPRSKKYHLLDFRPLPRKSWKYDFGSRLFLGDLLKTELYSSNYVYQLPCDENRGYFISQGYNGQLSHHGENALDFDLPVGTPVYAARAGVVTRVVDHHNHSCQQEDCNQYNNIVTIYHEDGTFADYVHLDHKGSLVKPGDQVKLGQHIAKSGNTGWTTGPHLHFVVYLPLRKGRRTLETVFATSNHPEGIYLEKGDKL